jgi:hypothetical protein
MRATSILLLLTLSACASAPSPQNLSGGIVTNSLDAFAGAGSKCRMAGKFAVIRYMDYADNTLTFDCIRIEIQIPMVPVSLGHYAIASVNSSRTTSSDDELTSN